MAQQKPSGLGKPGSALWAGITKDYTLRVDELLQLESACRVADTIGLLDAELRGASLTVTGSMGQVRDNPLLAEVRQQRKLLSALLRVLDLPDTGDTEMFRAAQRSTRGRHAAQERWTHGAA